MRPIVIAAGGTGGHFFPAEALTTALIARGHRVVLMTDARTVDRLGPVFSGIEHHVLHGKGIAGRGTLRAGLAVVSLAAGALQARKILSQLDAACVIGFGGYPSVPPVAGACLLRRRPAIILHEQNAVLGRATRLCIGKADLLALGFPDTAGVPRGATTIFTGNPVRPNIAALAGGVYHAPDDRINLLVLGGSLGARIFGTVIPEAIGQLPQTLRARLRVVQQCRQENLHEAVHAYCAIGVDAELAPFFNDVADRIAASHLVVSRAGASSCAELATVGRPAILIPLPSAIDDHQSANARAMPGAIVVPQGELTAARLAALLVQMLSDADGLCASARMIAAVGRADAAVALAGVVEELIAQVEAAR